MDEPWRYYAKQNTAVTKGQTLYDCACRNTWNRQIHGDSRRAAARGCGEGRVGRQCVVFRGSRVSVGDDENTLDMGGTDSHTVM